MNLGEKGLGCLETRVVREGGRESQFIWLGTCMSRLGIHAPHVQ